MARIELAAKYARANEARVMPRTFMPTPQPASCLAANDVASGNSKTDNL